MDPQPDPARSVATHFQPPDARVVFVSHPESSAPPPNLNIYGFQATVELDGRQIALGPTNVVPRGCEIKNAAWVIGVAVYSGMETKVMINYSGAPSKRNREIIIPAVIMLLCCSFVDAATGIWFHAYRDKLDTLPFYRKADSSHGGERNYLDSGLALEIVFAFLKSIFSYQNFIPISVHISIIQDNF